MKYNKDFSEDIELRGQSFRCRAIRPTDKNALIAALETMSHASRKNRFLTLKKGFTSGELKNFTDVDFDTHVGLCLVKVIDGKEVEPVGTVRFVRESSDISRAEFALTIVDKFQAMGMGSFLLDQLIIAARERGVQTLFGSASIENTAIHKLLKKKGKLRTTFVTQGIHELSFDIE